MQIIQSLPKWETNRACRCRCDHVGRVRAAAFETGVMGAAGEVVITEDAAMRCHLSAFENRYSIVFGPAFRAAIEEWRIFWYGRPPQSIEGEPPQTQPWCRRWD
jgi:hypothetical protein